MRKSVAHLRRFAHLPGVLPLRRLAGRFAAPGLATEINEAREQADHLRDHVNTLYSRSLTDNHRLFVLESGADEAHQEVLGRINDIERHLPTVLNTIASMNGYARHFRREFDQHLNRIDSHLIRLDEHTDRLDGHVRDELWPLKSRVEDLARLNEDVAWLYNRVEVIRAEILNELRYGRDASTAAPEVEIVNEGVVQATSQPARLNLGCGHVPLDGYVNVDMRRLPGVDIVAPVDALPYAPNSVAEIFSSHVLEHFPQQALERQLLPYWFELLLPGGEFRAVVPDVEAMITEYHAGRISFENLREVLYGGQEYEGDFHNTGFTPESLTQTLERAGFERIKVLERGRKNGDCLEFELAAYKPD